MGEQQPTCRGQEPRREGGDKILETDGNNNLEYKRNNSLDPLNISHLHEEHHFNPWKKSHLQDELHFRPADQITSTRGTRLVEQHLYPSNKILDPWNNILDMWNTSRLLRKTRYCVSGTDVVNRGPRNIAAEKQYSGNKILRPRNTSFICREQEYCIQQKHLV